MRHNVEDSYLEYVEKRREPAGRPEQKQPVVKREGEYISIVIFLCAVEFVLISVVAAVYATATYGVGLGIFMLFSFGVFVTAFTAGMIYIPAFLIAWPLLYLLRWHFARSEMGE